MHLAVIADTQFHGRDLSIQLEVLRGVLLDARERGCEWVVHCGDFTEAGRVWDRHVSAPDLVRRVGEVIDEAGLGWLVLPGNHDFTGDGTCSLDLFDRHPLVEVARYPQAWQLGPVWVLTLPWIRGTEVWLPPGDDLRSRCGAVLRVLSRQAVELKRAGHPVVLAAHAELAGVLENHWPVRPEDLEPFDEVVFGHVHDAAIWPYVGSLWQQNYGESDAACGWIHLESQGSRIIRRQTISPRRTIRYSTLTNHDVDMADLVGADLAEPAASRDPWLRVRWRDVGPPPQVIRDLQIPVVELPEEVVERPSRCPDDVGPDSSPEVLLRAWVGDREVSDLVWELLPSCPAPSALPSEGGLQGVEMLTLASIGPLGDFTFTPSSRTAVFGPVGSGKTMLIEAIYAGLYGRWPHAGRTNLSDVVVGPAGGIGMNFCARGRVWTVARSFGPGSTQKASISETGGPSVAGPAAVRKKVEELVGDPDMFLATAFLSQKAASDLVTASPSARMDTIRQLLGLDRFRPLSEYAVARARAISREIDEHVVRAQVGEDARKKGETLEEVIGAVVEALSSAEMDLRAADEALWARREAAKQRARLVELRKRHEQVEQTRAWTEAALAGARAREREAIAAKEELADLHRKQGALKMHQGRFRHFVEIIDESQRAADRLRSRETAGCASQGYLPCPFLDDASEADVARWVAEAERVSDEIASARRCGLPESVEKTDVALERVRSRIAHGQLLVEALPQTREEITTCERRVDELAVQLLQINPQIAELAEVEGESEIEVPGPLERAQRRSLELRSERDELRGRMKELAELVSAGEAAQARILVLRPERSAWNLIADAFGRGGIPQFLIDAARPALQRSCDRITTEHFDGRFRLILDTRRQLKSGESREAFSITFASDGRTFDAASCSGGQEAAVRVVLRLALGEWMAARQIGHSVLLLDEPTAAHDPEWSEQTMAAVADAEGFKQVVVVTHDDTVLGLFSERISL